MITKIPQVANAQRQQQSGLLKVGNVKISNLDSSLLEQVLSYVQALGSHHDDIVHYQMLYLVDKNAKGQIVKLPRTVIITQSLILLCHENLMSSAVELKILDSYSLKDIQQIYAEENALYVSVVFKRTKMLAKKKKWRLCTEGRNPSNKFVEECKRACADVGNDV
ncbi:hypothetical protein EON65_26295 [archaeon]|nr:MAG: hypothetical protein EON65_26295 [archaeon]